MMPREPFESNRARIVALAWRKEMAATICHVDVGNLSAGFVYAIGVLFHTTVATVRPRVLFR